MLSNISYISITHITPSLSHPSPHTSRQSSLANMNRTCNRELTIVNNCQFDCLHSIHKWNSLSNKQLTKKRSRPRKQQNWMFHVYLLFFWFVFICSFIRVFPLCKCLSVQVIFSTNNLLFLSCLFCVICLLSDVWYELYHLYYHPQLQVLVFLFVSEESRYSSPIINCPFFAFLFFFLSLSSFFPFCFSFPQHQQLSNVKISPLCLDLDFVPLVLRIYF